MNKQSKQSLDRAYKESPGLLLAGPVSDDEIVKAELELGCSFAPGYREFLERYGGGIVGSESIFGLRESETVALSVIEMTNNFRKQKWPGVSEWYVFSITADGNPIGADSAGKIWFSDHGIVKPLAATFDDYLVSILD